MRQRIGVGVIGLGKRWRRGYRPLIQDARGPFRVVAVADSIEERATLEARRLGCAAAAITELFERSDVEAVLLLEASWCGLWPVEQGCRLGKPLLCVPSLARDDPHADSLLRTIRARQAAILPDLAPTLAPATQALRGILKRELGAARLVTCTWREPAVPAPPERPSAWRLLGEAGSGVVAACLGLAGTPRAIVTAASEATDLVSVFIECASGRAVQITQRRLPAVRRRVILRVTAEQGSAAIRLPRRLRWGNGQVVHQQIVREEPRARQAVLERFARVVRREVAAGPDLEEAYLALQVLRAAERSRREGRRVSLES
jgi:predicted dehydrogenase